MIEIIILAIGLILAILIAIVKTFHLNVSSLSEFELRRRSEAGDKMAVRELKRLQLVPTLETAKNLKVIILTVALVATVVACLPVWLGTIASLIFLLLAEAIAAKGLLAKSVANLQAKMDRQMVVYLKKVSKLLRLIQPQIMTGEFSLNSIEELKQLIASDTGVLTETQKAQLLSTLKFEQIKIRDIMVDRDQIVTVGINETVGPLLLDRLHKAGHNIFPVVDKNLNNVKGLLYMSDLVPLDPDLKVVKDAVRTKIHSLKEDSKIIEVLKNSIQTGRQFFFVQDKSERIVGLITLKDGLKVLLNEDL